MRRPAVFTTLYVGTLGRFIVDGYLYPPQFLLFPRVLLGVTADFYRYRVLWFVFEVLVLLAALLVVARWIGGQLGQPVLMLSGLLLASLCR
jgi:alpha-1,2-mannosyltransferase